jgi:competence protein ComEC
MNKRSLAALLAFLGFLGCMLAFWLSWRTVAPVPQASSGEATVEFLDVGQGDSALITSPEGKTALIDAGPSGRVVDLLRDRGIKQLDLVVVSHHHADHYCGMKEVIRQFRPRLFLDTDSPHVTANYLTLLEVVQKAGITAIRAGPAARKIELGSITLTVFPQAPSNPKEENNNSIGIRLDYGDFSALFPGDSEKAERKWWMANVPELCEGVTILKLAHHGSRNGTDERWLALTRPNLAVASLGLGNEFGHPHAETLKLLRARAIPLKRTDLDGSITIRTDGLTWSVDENGKGLAFVFSGRSERQGCFLLNLGGSTGTGSEWTREVPIPVDPPTLPGKSGQAQAEYNPSQSPFPEPSENETALAGKGNPLALSADRA